MSTQQDSKRKFVNNNKLPVYKIKKTLPTPNNHNVHISDNDVHTYRHLSKMPVLTPPPIVSHSEEYQQELQLPSSPIYLDAPQRESHKRKREDIIIAPLPSPKSSKRPRSLCSPGTAEGESGQG